MDILGIHTFLNLRERGARGSHENPVLTKTLEEELPGLLEAVNSRLEARHEEVESLAWAWACIPTATQPGDKEIRELEGRRDTLLSMKQQLTNSQ